MRPIPEIDVDCGDDIFPERCPTPVPISIDGCKDSVEFNAGDLQLESLGRILQLDVTLKNVCPNKRVALAVIITETDVHGIEHKRGIKTMTIPAHTKKNCSDVIVRCIKFVLPEDLDTTGSLFLSAVIHTPVNASLQVIYIFRILTHSLACHI